jgi:hypothetical protein
MGKKLSISLVPMGGSKLLKTFGIGFLAIIVYSSPVHDLGLIGFLSPRRVWKVDAAGAREDFVNSIVTKC